MHRYSSRARPYQSAKSRDEKSAPVGSPLGVHPASTDFANISLEGEKPVKKKVPRQILHFSDGILEEYSTDEEDELPPPPPPVDPRTMTWGPWFWYYFTSAALKTFNVADSCGEKLAWFFGITSPKYQSAIDEFYRLKAEEDKEIEQEQKLRQHLEFSSVKVSEISETYNSVDKY